MGICIFCTNPANSKEDMFPQWILRRVKTGEPMVHRKPNRPVKISQSSKVRLMKIRTTTPTLFLALLIGNFTMSSPSHAQAQNGLMCNRVGKSDNAIAAGLGEFRTTSIIISHNVLGDGFFAYHGAKPIAELLAVVTYVLNDEQTEFSIVYHDAIPKTLFPSGTSPMTEFYGRHLPGTVGGIKDPVLTGTTIRLLGESPSILDSCPTNSKISFIRAIFADGTSSEYSSENWQLAAELIGAHWPVSIPMPLIPKSATLTASARISTDGSVDDLQIDHPEAVSYSLIESIRGNSTTWKVLPALQNGTPIQTTIAVAIRFRTVEHIAAEEPPQELVSGKTFLLVDYEALPESGRWQVSSAGKPAHKIN
jgi:hypothetical protein